ncbi:hypothetical protein I926_04000 [Pasteurella multocida subsp. multocida OH4807]|nr:hypothetical protein I926_04000 [Pasteurella multocida subsp. multocida OH4807]
MSYIDQASFHYQPEFRHIKTYDFGDGKLVSMFSNSNLKCVVETRNYDSSYSKCDIRKSKEMDFKKAVNLFKRLTKH